MDVRRFGLSAAGSAALLAAGLDGAAAFSGSTGGICAYWMSRWARKRTGLAGFALMVSVTHCVSAPSRTPFILVSSAVETIARACQALSVGVASASLRATSGNVGGDRPRT